MSSAACAADALVNPALECSATRVPLGVYDGSLYMNMLKMSRRRLGRLRCEANFESK